MGGWGQAKFYSPIWGRVEKVLLWGRGGGVVREKFGGLYPSLFWILNSFKNCVTFGNANILQI